MLAPKTKSRLILSTIIQWQQDLDNSRHSRQIKDFPAMFILYVFPMYWRTIQKCSTMTYLIYVLYGFDLLQPVGQFCLNPISSGPPNNLWTAVVTVVLQSGAATVSMAGVWLPLTSGVTGSHTANLTDTASTGLLWFPLRYLYFFKTPYLTLRKFNQLAFQFHL